MVNLLCTIGLLFPLLIQPVLNQRDAVFAQSDDEEPNSMVTSYAETFGISYAEAERRLLLQAEMSALEQKIREGEPTYAGSWMEHTPEFRSVVAFASPDGQTIIPKYLEGIPWADLVHVQQSPYTAVELLHISEQVNAAARATGIPFMSGPSYPRSKVVLYTASPDELRSQLEANASIQAYLGDIEYRTPIDDNGSLLLAQQTTQVCGTSLPTGSSGTVQSYNAYVVGQYWREGMWRGGVGYVRKVQLNNNGTINWGGAPAWSQCCAGQTAPLAQEGKIVGNHIYLNVFVPGGGCTEYKAPINNSGDPDWNAQTTNPCRTTAPGGGVVQSYNTYVLAQTWREGIWRNNLGYVRSVDLNNTNTDINYGGAPAWSSCCGGITPPDSQGGDILTYP